MERKFKGILLGITALAVTALAAGCSGDKTPYEINDSEDFTVSVKYDANGGSFTTNTSVIVDSFNITKMDKNSEGQAEIALIPPDNEARGNDAFTAIKNGYFLAGWYAERTESVDSDGNTVYTYSDKWDFENDLLKVDAGGSYTAGEPVMTLYAAWVPLFEVEFYSVDSGEYLDKYSFDPTVADSISVPAWNEETGTIEMYEFPEKSGYTFQNVYYDAAGSLPVDTAQIKHPGTVDLESGTATDHVMKLYVEWTEGEWYHIYNVEQFLDNVSVTGNYEIYADLDFEGEIWPSSLMYGNFSGTIHGNGHTISNVETVQTNNSKVNAGLFGYMTEDSTISDVTFENVTFTIKAGARMMGTCYGLLAGTISNEAELVNVNILNSTLQIDSACYFGVDDYSIGLLCGMGNKDKVPDAEIDCIAVGDDPESIGITVDGNTVTLKFKSE